MELKRMRLLVGVDPQEIADSCGVELDEYLDWEQGGLGVDFYQATRAASFFEDKGFNVNVARLFMEAKQ